MQKALIVLGIVILIVGVLWPWLGRIPLGRLPGDIVVNRPNLKVFIPITSMILLSVVVSLVFWIIRILRK
ncbi:DUF2905 domain-containing protein [Desulfoferrobacter suflitae]|uniref:DUF2905 domain-containing protein n=1 Tax=Desulfoferrobacter suflitae TaxID=2865782 RepID=UPI0021647D44|nr:DUF2905 domain-containing protein [Desulfoferrobacter suflitae]MCK8600443.1 DUF2905 domain-containing protein [Desulfoferrobacter suflitae]